MKKLIRGLVAAAAIVTPLAVAGTASAASTPADKATGTVTWDYQGRVTGTVIFNANSKTGGTLDYQNSWGQWLHAVVDPASFQKNGSTAVFGGEITSGSDDYTVGHDGP